MKAKFCNFDQLFNGKVCVLLSSFSILKILIIFFTNHKWKIHPTCLFYPTCLFVFKKRSPLHVYSRYTFIRETRVVRKMKELLLNNFVSNAKGEFYSNHNEIYSSPSILFDTTESFAESCKQSLFTALSKRLSCVK